MRDFHPFISSARRGCRLRENTKRYSLHVRKSTSGWEVDGKKGEKALSGETR